MSSITELSHQASVLRNILLSKEDSDIAQHADELLSFLNQLQDLMHNNPKSHNLPHIADIIQELESNPEVTLNNESIRVRLLDIFKRLDKRDF